MAALALTSSATARPITPAEKALVAETVGNMLKDPASAQFKLPPDVDETGGYCGQVNGKNAFGGYVGFRAFKVTIRQDTSQVINPPSIVRVLWIASARDAARYQDDCPVN